MATQTHARSGTHFERDSRPTPVVIGTVWMVAITLLLFFVPVINGLIGGAVGGYKVGSVGRALFAAVIPAIVVAFGLWALFAIFDAPGWGFLAGMTGAGIIALSEVGLFIGAAIGGAMSNRA